MSKASRLRAANTRIQPPRPPQLGLNSSAIPGGTGVVTLPGDITIGDLRWTPADGEADASPIGAGLALEHHQGAS